MKIEDYGRFKSINSVAISEKGNWLGYTYATPRKDDTLYIDNTLSEKQYVKIGNQASNPGNLRRSYCTFYKIVQKMFSVITSMVFT